MSERAVELLASPDGLARARNIKQVLMDRDGTLTDGGVCLISTTASEGSRASTVSQMKVFNAHAGQGLSLAHTMRIQAGFIRGRSHRVSGWDYGSRYSRRLSSRSASS
jgi:3-deoxy-D-manno-octulosonate 8-phosphate phosphatase (KDO 8-P phosphatase)